MNVTIAYVQEQVALVRELSADDEAAHGIEDDLWEEVLQAIAEGHPQAQQLAAEAIKTRSIQFSRWHG